MVRMTPWGVFFLASKPPYILKTVYFLNGPKLFQALRWAVPSWEVIL